MDMDRKKFITAMAAGFSSIQVPRLWGSEVGHLSGRHDGSRLGGAVAAVENGVRDTISKGVFMALVYPI